MQERRIKCRRRCGQRRDADASRIVDDRDKLLWELQAMRSGGDGLSGIHSDYSACTHQSQVRDAPQRTDKTPPLSGCAHPASVMVSSAGKVVAFLFWNCFQERMHSDCGLVHRRRSYRKEGTGATSLEAGAAQTRRDSPCASQITSNLSISWQ